MDLVPGGSLQSAILAAALLALDLDASAVVQQAQRPHGPKIQYVLGQ